jgi:UDP-glucose:(heptosyl)LPS alpha-1,3-glucosyltransferase
MHGVQACMDQPATYDPHRKLRVALVLERFDPAAGGLESWTWQFAHFLHERGHQVTIVASAFAEARDVPFGRQRFVWDASPLTRAANAAVVLQQLDVDIVHDTGVAPAADVLHPHTGSRVLSLDRHVAALPLVARVRHALSPAFRRWRTEVLAGEREQMLRAGCVVAVSGSVEQDLVDRYGIPAHRMAVVRNGVDTERFAPARRDAGRAGAREFFDVKEAVVFLSVAREFKLKGVDATLAALARLVREGRSVRLFVAGDGPIAEYQRIAARLGIANVVSFLGHVEDMPRLHALADVYIHPTFHDACSLATLEALASGLPVITTRANGAADAMVSGGEGYVLDRAGDVPALAEAMRALLEPDRRRELGAAAARLGQCRSFEQNCRELLGVYDGVLAAGGVRPEAGAHRSS